MNIVIPFNSGYIKQRYNLDDDFVFMVSSEVMPNLISRFSMDSKVDSIEIISDIDFKGLALLSNKVTSTVHEIGDFYDQNEVVCAILNARHVKSDIIVQVNPLYPFVSVDSLHRAYAVVKDGCVKSSVGSFSNKAYINEEFLIKEYDRGIFNIYKEKEFRKNNNRVTLPFDAVGLKAVELICLRSKIDIELYDLVINSGFEQ